MVSLPVKLSSSNPVFCSGEIHLWVAVLDQPEAEMPAFLEMLSHEERARAARFLFPKDRERFIARHGILRVLLGRYLGVPAGELWFCHGKNGKPALAEGCGKEAIHFSLSRSKDIALFAFSRTNELGVDIEQIRVLRDRDQLVDRYFSPKEKFFFHALPHDRKTEAFFRYWTGKEAFVKATGEGLARPLDSFEITVGPPGTGSLLSVQEHPGEGSDWSIMTFRPAGEYAGALAVKSRRFTISSFPGENTRVMLAREKK